MADPAYGWLSVLPPVVAIVLAIATRQVILSLLAGVIAGAAILASSGQAPQSASGGAEVARRTVIELCEKHLWTALVDEDHLRVFAFTLLMGAMVGVIYRSGGMQGLVAWLAPRARSRRGGQLVTWLAGLAVFFDDYANTLLLGNTMRPLTDRLRISREKLAYLVDSTAAPVAGLALVSTWVATEIGFIADGMSSLEWTESADPFRVFLVSIPYRFYVLWALLLVPLIAVSGRDFGPMLRAERAAWAGAGPRKTLSDYAGAPPERAVGHPLLAIVPVAVMLGVVLWLLMATGRAAVQESGAAATLLNIFGNADSYVALLYGSLSGLLTAAIASLAARRLSPRQTRAAALRGALHVLPALTILWLAWTLSAQTREDALGTGLYLAGVLKQTTPAYLVPTVVFVLSSLVAFATGTSWGTMGILMPLSIRACHGILAVGGAVDPFDPIMVGTVGSVLAGAIFGDHCSPISDTTVLSSQASGCDHIAHVWTQFPYALAVGVAAALVGTLPIGLGAPLWIVSLAGPAALIAMVWIVGRPIDLEAALAKEKTPRSARD